MYDQGACHALGWLAGRLGGWLGGWLRPREAQIGPERRSLDRTSLSCAWLEAPHQQIYDHGGSPLISLWNPRGSPRGLSLGFQTGIHFKPMVSPQAELRPGRLPTNRITTREAPHKRFYDQGAYVPTKRITTRALAGWLVGWRNDDQGACLALGWLAGWLVGGLAGWLRPREPREAQRGGAWICRRNKPVMRLAGGSPQED